MSGMKDYENFTIIIEQGKNIINKFMENFFIAKLMDESNKMETFGLTGMSEETKEE